MGAECDCCGQALGDELEGGFTDQLVPPGIGDTGPDLQRLVEGAGTGLGKANDQLAAGLAGCELDRSGRDPLDVSRQHQFSCTGSTGTGSAQDGERQLHGIAGAGDDGCLRRVDSHQSRRGQNNRLVALLVGCVGDLVTGSIGIGNDSDQ
mgnify:CR=1 FL=1